ncbi:MAG: hypothetical protein JXQ27_15680 [Acidobacteria bacterium]|nr:hypothetical protein [Acidobacteriota bacterium]
MRKRHPWTLLAVMGLLTLVPVMAQEGETGRYHNPAEVSARLKQMAQAQPEVAHTHTLARTPGGRELVLLEIGPEIGTMPKRNPAVFVAANFDGLVPLATEAALHAARVLLEKAELRNDRTWYILPVGNPDAAARYHDRPLALNSGNDQPWNDDMDDRIDEDGPDDLNNDGLITRMRVKHPEGEWLPVPGEPRAMKKADWAKGDRGIYKLYPEGLDNDGDGRFNEDGTGGVNMAINFPHLFPFGKPGAGWWAGSADETYALLQFITEHKEIGLTFALGRTNFCRVPPKGGRKGEADFNKIKIPEEIGKRMGLDTTRTYTMAEIMEMVQRFVPPGMEISESMVASFLGLGAVVNPLPEDLKFYNELSEKYKEFLKEKKLDAKRLEPAPAADGSFELWVYYHLGLPSFSLDFWTLPEPAPEKKAEDSGTGLTPETVEQMSNEEFIALGEEKIGAFLKEIGAPAQFSPAMVIGALQGGMMTTKRMAEMMRRMEKRQEAGDVDPETKALLEFSDAKLAGAGFVTWQPFNHPTLGEVEIGGEVPFADTTPPPDMIRSLVEGQVPWMFEIAKRMPRVGIAESRVTPLDGGVSRVEVWVANQNYLPYPTAMGQRCGYPAPVVVTLTGEGLRLLEGRARRTIKALDGFGTHKIAWVVQAPPGSVLTVAAATPNAWGESAQIQLGGAQ